ncbi:MAG: single-stranded DNA-binding protein [Clostridia bacterium]|nr:single-stranded DNA-binding protein [Clostridia bacterium]
MASLNKVVLIGHMVADPELKQTTSGISVCSFRIGVSRRYTKGEQAQSDFFDIVAWRQQAEFVARYFRKGSAICVCGSLQTRTWEDKNGGKRYNVEIVADEINFIERKGGDSGRVTDEFGTPPPAYNSGFGGGYNSGAAEAPKFEEIAGDDDLPF